MIRVEQVSKRFGDRLVLDRVSVEIPDSKVVVILGPTGIGKTVLLRIMAGLLVPDAGTVSYDQVRLGRGLFTDNREILARIGFVFQAGALFDSLSVEENVALPLKEQTRMGRAELETRVRAALARVGMLEHAGLYPPTLSGGMIRLAAIGRALATSPRYVFYDEPTSGLDPRMRDRICKLIASLRDQEEKTQVVVTHDLETVETVADRIYMLRDSRLTALEQAGKEDYEKTHS